MPITTAHYLCLHYFSHQTNLAYHHCVDDSAKNSGKNWKPHFFGNAQAVLTPTSNGRKGAVICYVSSVSQCVTSLRMCRHPWIISPAWTTLEPFFLCTLDIEICCQILFWNQNPSGTPSVPFLFRNHNAIRTSLICPNPFQGQVLRKSIKHGSNKIRGYTTIRPSPSRKKGRLAFKKSITQQR